jgi:putative phosphoribosyl transferase
MIFVRMPQMKATAFLDRRDAGQQLAAKLGHYAHRTDVLVIGLPRGGVPVAYEVAESLGAPLDILLVRKLGVPGERELAMGAIASGGVQLLNQKVVQALRIPDYIIAEVAVEEARELIRRERLYRGDIPAPVVRDRTIIAVDDGIATGSSMRAAVSALRGQQPARIVIAVPVVAADTFRSLQMDADEVVAVLAPEYFVSVGSWYTEFPETGDEEIKILLDRVRCQSVDTPPEAPLAEPTDEVR